MTVSGASAAGAYAMSQQVQSLTQHKTRRHPSIADVKTEAANAANTSSPARPSAKPGAKPGSKASAMAGHQVDIAA
jgi:hypothetical protein